MENPENGSASTDAENREAMWDELDNNVDAQPNTDADVKEDDESQEGDVEQTLSDDEGDASPESETVEETQEVKAETPKSDDDFLSTLDPEIRGKVEETIKQQEAKFEQLRKSDEGRVKAAQRQANELSHVRRKLAEYESKEQEAANQKLAEKFEEIPELGEAINAVQNQFDEKLKRVEQNGQLLRQERENELKARSEEQYNLIVKEHSDFDKIDFDKLKAYSIAANTPDNNFAQIFDNNNLHFTDAAGVSALVTAYKDFTDPNRAKPQEPQASADDVKTLARRRNRQQQATEQAVSSSNVVTKTGIPEQGSREQLWESFKDI